MVQALRVPATRRTLAKQQTRRRLIEAAKALVAERGYDAATLRDVAALAGMSTGAVFANFADKADLFNEVMIDELSDLLVQMKRKAAVSTSPRDALVDMLAAGYAAYAERLSLAQALLGFSWSRSSALEQRCQSLIRMILDALAEVLRMGIQSGELAPRIDADLIAEMAWDGYVANFRRAIFDSWTLEALRVRLARQVDMLLDGAVRRDAQPSCLASGGVSRQNFPAALRG